MSIVVWIILGLIAGWVASLITKSPESMLMNIVVGIIGAFIGGMVLNLFGVGGVSGLNLPSILTAVLGAVILLAIVRAFRHSSMTT